MKNYRHYSSRQLLKLLQGKRTKEEKNQIELILNDRKITIPKLKKIGVIETIFQLIKNESPISNLEIWDKLIQKFPERNPEKMYNTLKLQIMTNKRPVMMERVRNVEFVIEKRDTQIKIFSLK